jgi:actin-like ATPase involved in cell morphogenesis
VTAAFRLGIDFGTSNTVAVLCWPDGRARPLLFDGSPLLPSAVFLDDAGRLLVGRDAQLSARADPSRFEPNPKRGIDSGAVLLGEVEVPVPRVVAAVLRRVGVEADRVIGAAARETCLTHPASWGRPRRRVLLDAAAAAGLGEVRLVPEPIAAAEYFLRHSSTPVPPGRSIVVYDLGAGTFDVSVVRREPTSFTVLASDGLPDVGGLDIDAALVGYFGAVYGVQQPENWQRLEQPRTAGDRRAHRQLWEDVRAAKELLSRSGSTVVFLNGIDVEVQLGREQLDQLATGLLRRTVDLTRVAIRRAGVEVADLAGLFLVGGSSRMPLVATLLHRTIGIPPLVLEQPELVVAEGGAAVLAEPTPIRQPPPLPPRPGSADPADSWPRDDEDDDRDGAGEEDSGEEPDEVEEGDDEVHADDGPVPAPARSGGGSAAWLWRPFIDQMTLGRPWREVPFHPIVISLPSDDGYTMRAFLRGDHAATFLGDSGGPLLFRSTEGLARYLVQADDHFLARLPGWDQVRRWVADAAIEPDTDDRFELDLITYNLRFSPAEWMPRLLIRGRDLAAQLAIFFDLDDISTLLATGSELDRLDDILREIDRSVVGRRARRQLDTIDPRRVIAQWSRIVRRIDQAARWRD